MHHAANFLARNADRNVEVVRDVEDLLRTQFRVPDGIAVALKTAARTKREGGVKSPGNPCMPLP
jgi:hypothetical protein